jgi:MraZ protein
MFRGVHEYLVDDKGRVAIPARFREVLSGLQDERLVVTKFKRRGRPCLDVYPLSTWLRLEERISEEKVSSKKQFGRKMDIFESWYVGAAQDVQIDAQGRMLIPPTLRDWAGIGREVILAAQTQKFRIWDKSTYLQVDREDEHQLFEDPEFLDELGL